MKRDATPISFIAELYKLKGQTVLRLPEEASERLSSRGQVAVTGSINDYEFTAVLEPDGYWGHWLRVDEAVQKAAKIKVGDAVKLTLTQAKDWPEPVVPKDVATALTAASEKVQDKWQDITPMARWEWIRWINATTSTDTRAIRIEKTISKLGGKHRRPCCFNLAACTDPDLSKSGRLIGSAPSDQ